MKGLTRTLKNSTWYFVIMWAGIAYNLFCPLEGIYWFAAMLGYALVVYLLISKLRQILKF